VTGVNLKNYYKDLANCAVGLILMLIVECYLPIERYVCVGGQGGYRMWF
jgi:hypothetical protein